MHQIKPEKRTTLPGHLQEPIDHMPMVEHWRYF
jgi:hypothetical protein